jgi:molybdopterin synthase sulfur carrier subunit
MSMITVQVRYFASLREALGSGETLTLPAGARVADLRAALVLRGGEHAERLAPGRAVRCAVAQVMCADEQALLSDGAEVAFFPPVTGG